jgi:hypothetical protein
VTSIDGVGFTPRVKTAEGMKGTRISSPCEVRTPEEARKVLLERVRRCSPIQSRDRFVAVVR